MRGPHYLHLVKKLSSLIPDKCRQGGCHDPTRTKWRAADAAVDELRRSVVRHQGRRDGARDGTDASDRPVPPHGHRGGLDPRRGRTGRGSRGTGTRPAPDGPAAARAEVPRRGTIRARYRRRPEPGPLHGGRPQRHRRRQRAARRRDSGCAHQTARTCRGDHARRARGGRGSTVRARGRRRRDTRHRRPPPRHGRAGAVRAGLGFSRTRQPAARQRQLPRARRERRQPRRHGRAVAWCRQPSRRPAPRAVGIPGGRRRAGTGATAPRCPRGGRRDRVRGSRGATAGRAGLRTRPARVRGRHRVDAPPGPPPRRRRESGCRGRPHRSG